VRPGRFDRRGRAGNSRRRNLDVDAGRLGPGEKAVAGRREQLRGIDLLGAERILARSEAVDRPQLADEALQPICLLADRAPGTSDVVARCGPIHERGREAGDHRQGSPQVVAKVCEQLSLTAARVGELAGHRVERARQRANLGRPLEGQGHRGPQGQARSRIGDPFEWAGHAPGDEPCERRRHEQDHQRNSRDRAPEIGEGKRPRPVRREERDRPRRRGGGSADDRGRVQVRLAVQDDAAADRVAGRAVGLHDRVADWLAGDRSKPAVGPDEHDLDVARGELCPDVLDRAPQVPRPDALADLWQDTVGHVREAA